jgi:putative oxidoreductase
MKKLFSTRTSDTAFNLATLLLRLGFGLLLLLNFGFAKLTHYGQLQQHFGDPLGLGLSSSISLALVVFAEFFCAAFVVLGLFTRLACVPIIITMMVAFFKVHHMTYAGEKSGQMALIFLLAFFVILLTGPGKASLDKFIGK